MPSYKDETTGTWYCKFYYQDWTGTRKQKLKRGFKLQREAKAWERIFLETLSKNPEISFSALVEKYRTFITPRIKATTSRTKFNIIENYILPYFEKKRICDVSEEDVALWQNELITQNMKPTYIHAINVQLVALFNYAVRYCGLSGSPCRDLVGKSHRDKNEIQFWTLTEYKEFISHVEDIRYRTAFEILYYTGMRVGEMLALTSADISPAEISINKTYILIKGVEHITEPKTPKSKRIISIPSFLYDEIQTYREKLYGLQPDDRLFTFAASSLTWAKDQICSRFNLKRIRIHDIRHSHASLLIELNFSPLLISERLGHEKVETTLNIYSHLYPHKQQEVAETLNNLVSK